MILGARFVDLAAPTDTDLNAVDLSSSNDLRAMIVEHSRRAPHFVEIQSRCSGRLLLGLGGVFACAQFTGATGDPPYLMVVSQVGNQEQYREFLMGNEPTPVPTRYCVPAEIAADVAVHFLERGGLLPDVIWEAL